MPWDVIEAGSKAGFRTAGVPPEYGGPSVPLTPITSPGFAPARCSERPSRVVPSTVTVMEKAFGDETMSPPAFPITPEGLIGAWTRVRIRRAHFTAVAVLRRTVALLCAADRIAVGTPIGIGVGGRLARAAAAALASWISARSINFSPAPSAAGAMYTCVPYPPSLAASIVGKYWW